MSNSQLDTTNESQEVSPFPAGDHKAHINRRAQISKIATAGVVSQNDIRHQTFESANMDLVARKPAN